MMKSAQTEIKNALLFAGIVLFLFCAPAAAQDATVDAPKAAEKPAAPLLDAAGNEIIDPFLNIDLNQALRLNLALRKTDVEPSKLKTLFFTLWQHELLQEAKRTFRTRPPTQDEIQQADQIDPNAPRPRGPREVSVGGIVYKSPSRWTVWLNGARIAPDAIPKEIIDIKVYKKYVELKWYDSYTNLIYPIRLKPHQRFNLDSRIFLPGTGIM